MFTKVYAISLHDKKNVYNTNIQALEHILHIPVLPSKRRKSRALDPPRARSRCARGVRQTASNRRRDMLMGVLSIYFQGPMGLRGESGKPGDSGKPGAMVRSRTSRS